MVFALLPLGAFQQQPEMPFRYVERPSFRVEDLGSGYRPPGTLVYEAVLENITASYATGEVSFSSYLPDGTKHDECKGDGFTVVPGGKVRVQCQSGSAQFDIRLQVTMRLRDVRTYTPTPESTRVTVAEQGVRHLDHGTTFFTSSPYFDPYEVWALLQSRGGDAKVKYAFRLYDKDGIQIAEAFHRESIVVEPEVKRRVNWETKFYRREKPVSVRTYVFDITEPAKKGAAK
jgi:hypothetical protein